MDTATISDTYRQAQQAMHLNPAYGTASVAMAPLVAQVIRAAQAKSLSDYGAGKKRLQGALSELGLSDVTYLPFDPAFPEYGEPQPADLVCCIDVLEHVEPECLDAVLDDLRRVTKRLGFFSIHLGPAQKVLPDGRNAHLIQQSISWWLLQLAPRFEVIQLQTHQVHGNGVWIIVKPQAEAR